MYKADRSSENFNNTISTQAALMYYNNRLISVHNCSFFGTYRKNSPIKLNICE